MTQGPLEPQKALAEKEDYYRRTVSNHSPEAEAGSHL